MPEPFKNLISPRLVADTAAHLARVDPAFDAARFRALAGAGLEQLELKARVMQVAGALEATLPADFGAAAAVIEAALAPVAPGGTPDTPGTAGITEQGLAGWVVWPLGEFVARRGLDQPDRALATLHALTQRLTAEFAIRPFLLHHPEVVWRTFARWVRDPSPHVRRLVSEGSRPRLPWGLQLKPLIADPSPSLPLLRQLMDDDSPYVRRSVANHLNDIAKDHPGLVADWVETHLPGAGARRRQLLQHACRTLIKAGDARILALWGHGRPLQGQAALSLQPPCVVLGGSLTLRLSVRSTSRQPQPLVADLRLHFVKADGSTSPKVFKGWKVVLPAHGELELTRQLALRPVTTRRHHAGRHRLEVQVNGRAVAEGSFDLQVPPPAPGGHPRSA